MQLRQRIRQIEFNYDFAVFSQTAVAYQVKEKGEDTIIFISYDHDEQTYMVAEINDNYYSSVPYATGSVDQCIQYIENRYKEIISKEDYRVKASNKKRSSLDPLI